MLIQALIEITNYLHQGKWFRFDRNPLELRSDATRQEILKVTRYFLKQNDWIIIEPAEWANVWMRAEKNGIVLNVIVHESHTGWRILINDAAEATRILGAVGIISAQPVPKDVIDALKLGTFAVTTTQLMEVEDLTFLAVSAIKKAQRLEFDINSKNE